MGDKRKMPGRESTRIRQGGKRGQTGGSDKPEVTMGPAKNVAPPKSGSSGAQGESSGSSGSGS